MKIYLASLIILTVSNIFSTRAQEYNYSVDLVNIDSDRISVDLCCPGIKDNNTKFCFPAIIPGHHYWVNYGRFIDDLKAFDIENNELPVKRSGLNDFEITGARKLFRITYYVNDTEDSKLEEKVMGWSETNFVAGELFVINPGGVFGFFEGMENLPLEVTFHKPSNLYGSTALTKVHGMDDKQVFKADDYHKLVDCPILFAPPDTASIEVGNSYIEVACYNKSKENTASYIAELLIPRMQAVANFAGGELPVDRYVFLYYLRDYSEEADLFYNETITGEKIQERIIKKHGIPVLGALEHSNSSFHNLVYVGKNRLTDELLISSAVHEFLHIYTPLNLRSNIRANFNYSKPHMSKHLWLYEGVTEYFSDLAMVKSGIISLSDYLNYELRLKIFTSKQYPDDMIFTEMSERIFEEPFKKQFIQVYYRGAMLALLLDLEIMKLSEGKLDLRGVLFSLINKYGKDNPFDEESIFDEITAMVHPDLRTFFGKYIEGTDNLDYDLAFALAGISFKKETEIILPRSILSKGFGVEDVIEFFGAYTINEVSKNSPFKAGDKILSSDFGYNCLKPFIKDNGEFITDGESIEIPVFRNGKWIELILAPEEFANEIYKYQLSLSAGPSKLQQKLFNKWVNN